jgi:hypothetical protein
VRLSEISEEFAIVSVRRIDHGHFSIELHTWCSAESCTFAMFIYAKGSERLLQQFTGSDEDESHLASAEIVRAEFVKSV